MADGRWQMADGRWQKEKKTSAENGVIKADLVSPLTLPGEKPLGLGILQNKVDLPTSHFYSFLVTFFTQKHFFTV
jgi:hypothetical protein